MRLVEKDFKKPPAELKACAQKYKELFQVESEDAALKIDCYQKARDALEELYYGKCAYCETYILPGSYIRIDHYRPKSIYKWLAVEWSNLVSSCERCNINKGNQFPVPEEPLRAIEGVPESEDSLADSKKLLNENALLLHPELDDPWDYLEFKTDGSIKEKNGSERGKTTIEICGLNRDTLRRERKEQIDEILSSIRRVTLLIVSFLIEIPKLYKNKNNKKALLLLFSFYNDVFNRLQSMQEKENRRAFTLLASYMNEEFENFIISRLPDNEDMKTIVRTAFILFKEQKL